MFGHSKIDRAITGVVQGDLSQLLQCGYIWITERPQVRGVDLGMTVELTKITVCHGGIEEAAEAAGQRGGEPRAFAMEEIEMILNTKETGWEIGGIEHPGDESAFFLL